MLYTQKLLLVVLRDAVDQTGNGQVQGNCPTCWAISPDTEDFEGTSRDNELIGHIKFTSGKSGKTLQELDEI